MIAALVAGNLISALITLLVFVLIFALVYWIIGQFTLPSPIGKIVNIILVVIGVVFLIYFLLGLVGCSATVPVQKQSAAAVASSAPPLVSVTGHNMANLVTTAADVYIERKAGNTDWVHSIAQGFRAYGAAMTSVESVKKMITQFSAGRKADESFIDSLATYWASSKAPGPVKSETVARLIENVAIAK